MQAVGKNNPPQLTYWEIKMRLSWKWKWYYEDTHDTNDTRNSGNDRNKEVLNIAQNIS